MKFFGKNEIIWDKENSQALCRFENGELETTDKRTISILKELGYRSDGNGETVEGDTEGQETEEKQTKAEIIKILTEREIEFNPRDKKEVLAELLKE